MESGKWNIKDISLRIYSVGHSMLVALDQASHPPRNSVVYEKVDNDITFVVYNQIIDEKRK